MPCAPAAHALTLSFLRTDFSFDWHISWAPVSSLKLSIGGIVGNGLSTGAGSNASAWERAQAQDFADIFRASLSLSLCELKNSGAAR